jgi:DNA-binding GntR family transcriptional regulator
VSSEGLIGGDAVLASMLAEIRDGRIGRGTIVDERAIAERTGRSRAAVRMAVVRLVDLGLVAPEDGGARVVAPTFEDWADASRAVLCLWGITLRWTVPLLTNDEVVALRAIIDRADALRARRDDEYGSVLVAMVEWAVEHTRNRLLRDMLRTAMFRWRFAMEARPVFRQWEASSFSALLVTALLDRDGPLAQEAVLATARNAERHLQASRPTDAVPAPRPRPPAPIRAIGVPRIVGAIRDGRLPPGTPLDDILLVGSLGVPREAVPDAVARLTSIGLVAWDGSVPRVATTTWDDWLDAYQAFASLVPVVFAWTAAGLDEVDGARAVELLDEVDQAAELRDDRSFSPALTRVEAFLGDRMPNTVLAEQFRIVLDRVTYIRDPMPPFREWRVEGVTRALRTAIADHDPDIAADAGRIVMALCERHIRRVLAEYASMEGWVPKS